MWTCFVLCISKRYTYNEYIHEMHVHVYTWTKTGQPSSSLLTLCITCLANTPQNDVVLVYHDNRFVLLHVCYVGLSTSLHGCYVGLVLKDYVYTEWMR